MIVVDRHTAHRIVVGEITQARLPSQRRPPRPGQVIPVRRDTFSGGIAGEVMVMSSYLSRDRDHPPSEICPRYTFAGRRITTDEPREPRAWLCGCPRIGHDKTLSPEALRALGHDSLASYVREWLLARDQAWLARSCPPDILAATTYDAAERALGELPGARLFDRWEQRWADLAVWVIEWTPQVERPRLLARPGRLRYRTDHHGRHVVDDREDREDEDLGYTTRLDRALASSEPEAIDTALLRPWWARQAAERHAAAAAPRDRARHFDRRLRGL